MKQLFTLVFSFFPFLLFAQLPNVDSLVQTIPNIPVDTNKVLLLDSIGTYYLKHHLDSTPIYAKQALALAKKLDYEKGLIESYNLYGNYHERKTSYDSALYYYNQGLEICRANNNVAGLAIILNNLGIVQTRLGQYQEAMKLYFEALEAEEIQGNEKGMAEAYNNIGIVYYYMQDVPKTVEYLEKSIEIEERLGHDDILLKGYNNIGALYDYLKDYDKALEFYEKSYALSSKLKDRAEMSINLNNIAMVHYSRGDYKKAEEYQQQSLALKEEIGDFRGAAYSYHNFASLEKAKGNVEKAEAFYLKGLEIAESRALVNVQSETYKNLAELFREKKDLDKAYGYLMQHMSLRDSVLSLDRAKAVAELEAKYQNKKKENEILEQRAVIAEGDLKLARKNRQLLLFIAIAVVLGLLAVLFINQQRLRNKQLQQENELKEARAKIELQQGLEAQRLSISRDLHDNIASQLTFIISSMDNLKYLFKLEEGPLLQKIQSISNFSKNTTYELRDTIWAMNKGFVQWKDMQERIENYLRQADEMTDGIDFEFILDKNVDPTHNFSATEGMHIYRIIQEGVNNALKYAEPSKIELSVEQKEQKLKLIINDNGKGFDEDEVEFGNGLFNMEKRAEAIGGSFELHAAIGEGTSLVLEIPMV
jgi:signal transduction histidine kinase/Flp pilus assembly protein TadD